MAKRKCVRCNEYKTYEFSGKVRPDTGSRTFIDHKGRNWKGAKCPDCRTVMMREMRKLEHAAIKPVITKRKCRRCGAQLEGSRYFHCSACIPADVRQEPCFSGEYGYVR